MAGGSVRAGKAVVELGIKDRTAKQLRAAAKRLKKFGASIGSMGVKIGGFAVAAAAPIAFATKTFADFSDQMSTVGAVTGATSTQLASMTEQAKLLGRTTSFTASQVAGLQIELGRAGFKPAEIEAATEDILALGRATGTDLPRAAEIAASTIRQFGLSAEESGRVSDVLTATVNGSAQTLDDFAEAMKDLGPLAAETGLSLEEVATSVGLVANIGLKGSKAGTGIARALKELSTEAKQAKLLKEFGISALDADRNMRPLHEILIELNDATKDLGSGDRLAAFNELFGRGVVQASALSQSGDEFEAFVDKLRNSEGVAKSTATAMDDNLGGAFRRFMSAVEGIQIAVGEALEGPLGKLVDGFSSVANKITDFLSANKQVTLIVAGVIVGMLALSGILIATGLAFTVIGVAVGGLAAIISSPLLLLAAIAVALVAGTAAWLKWSNTGKMALTAMQLAFGNLFSRFDGVWTAITTALKDGRIADAFEVIADTVELAWVSMLNILIQKLNQFAKEVGSVVGSAATAMAKLRGFSDFEAGVIGAAIQTAVSLGINELAVSAQRKVREAENEVDKHINDPRNAEVRAPMPTSSDRMSATDAVAENIGKQIAQATEGMGSAGSSTAQLSTAAGFLGSDMQGEIKKQTTELKKQTRLLDEIEGELDGGGGLGA